MKKKILLLFLTFTLTSGIFTLWGQVTVGGISDPQSGAVLDLNANDAEKYRGGLLLPHVAITDLEKIPADFTDFSKINKTALKGIIVYNTINDGVYFWDGTKWEIVSYGNFISTCDTIKPVSYTGGNISCTIFDPLCNVEGIYRFNFIVGENYTSLNILDASTGNFSLQFDSNDWASPRVAVLMVTTPCGNSSTYVYVQEGDVTNCDGSIAAPDIKANKVISNGSITICGGGAVYFYIDNPDENALYIWTLNNDPVGYGAYYQATQPGKYVVYINKTGCSNSASVQVKLNGEAPAPVETIIAANNGFVCNSTGTVSLYSNKSGNIVWYKDGRRTDDKRGAVIQAGIGEWFAVIELNDCSSVPSNTVIVQEYPNSGGNLNVPNIKINDQSFSSNGNLNICGKSFLNLSVTNFQQDVTYLWYLDNTEIGTGQNIHYSLVNLGGSAILRCRATKTGSCPVEIAITLNISGSPLEAPSVLSNSGNAICNGSAVLTANIMYSEPSEYIWYFSPDNDEPTVLAGKNSKIITVEKAGIYRVSAKNGNCISEWSDPFTLKISNFVNAYINGSNIVTEGETRIYTATVDNLENISYEWQVKNAVIMSGQNTRQVVVFFPAKTDSSEVSVFIENSCGRANNYPATISNIKVIGDQPGDEKESLDKIPAGSGVFSGKTKFDVAKNSGELLNYRKNRQDGYPNLTDFSSSDSIQQYFFTPTIPISEVAFESIESEAGIIHKIIPAKVSGNAITSVPFVIQYNGNLNNMANGHTKTNPLFVDVYAVYKTTPNSPQQRVKMRIFIQDDLFCGAKTTGGGWLTFMCHNLGASENKSIAEQLSYLQTQGISATSTDSTVYGSLYQWGRLADGHQLRNNQQVTQTLATDVIPGHSQLISFREKPYDWITSQDTAAIQYPERWGDNGTDNTMNPKTASDPCPEGWRVPSMMQWASIYTPTPPIVGKDIKGLVSSQADVIEGVNVWTWKQPSGASGNNGYGYMVGEALFLPAGGQRDNTPLTLSLCGEVGRYWSSTTRHDAVGLYGSARLLRFQKEDTYTYIYSTRVWAEAKVDPYNYGVAVRGSSVRCVSEF
jgi:uncharacterized protein (TIGR02145 family)